MKISSKVRRNLHMKISVIFDIQYGIWLARFFEKTNLFHENKISGECFFVEPLKFCVEFVPGICT